MSPAPALFSCGEGVKPQSRATAAAADNSQIQAAQQRLNEARRALDEGRQVRYGNERNYAKYLERIAGLEAAVQQSEQALQQLQTGGSAAPR